MSKLKEGPAGFRAAPHVQGAACVWKRVQRSGQLESQVAVSDVGSRTPCSVQQRPLVDRSSSGSPATLLEAVFSWGWEASELWPRIRGQGQCVLYVSYYVCFGGGVANSRQQSILPTKSGSFGRRMWIHLVI